VRGIAAGWFGEADFARTDADLASKTTANGLKAYAGIVCASTTGDLPLADRRRFLDWIGEGHAFVGIHSATDTFPGLPGVPRQDRRAVRASRAADDRRAGGEGSRTPRDP